MRDCGAGDCGNYRYATDDEHTAYAKGLLVPGVLF